MSTPAAQPRNLAQLAWEIRHAWITASAAIPLPDGIEKATYLAEDLAADPRLGAILDARHTAFEWALNELVDGDYQAPGWIVRALREGVLPDRDRPGTETETRA